MESLGMNRDQFARAIGVTTPAICDWLVNGKTLGKIVLQIIEAYPNLSAEWLLRGTGEMFLDQTQTINNVRASATAPVEELIDPMSPRGIAFNNEVTRWQAVAEERNARIESLTDKVENLTREVAVAEYRAQKAEAELLHVRGYIAAEPEQNKD